MSILLKTYFRNVAPIAHYLGACLAVLAIGWVTVHPASYSATTLMVLSAPRFYAQWRTRGLLTSMRPKNVRACRVCRPLTVKRESASEIPASSNEMLLRTSKQCFAFSQ